MVMPTARKWNRDELLVALNLYRKLSFGQLHARNPVIIELAAKLDRSANSVAMKLCNFASLDPLLRARGVRGLEGASALDRTVWADFMSAPVEVAAQSEEALRHLFGAKDSEEVEVEKSRGIWLRPPVGPTEQLVTVKARRSQQFFRQMILNSFDSRCCVSRLPVRELLVASHIVPWSDFPNERLNPQNGLCLSRLHDGAFDAGLIAFDDDRKLVMSKRLKKFLPQTTVQQNFEAFAGIAFALPEDAPEPRADFLRYHREQVFTA
jgi:putative restriction endonuclease